VVYKFDYIFSVNFSATFLALYLLYDLKAWNIFVRISIRKHVFITAIPFVVTRNIDSFVKVVKNYNVIA